MFKSFAHVSPFALITLVAGIYTLLGKLGLSLAMVHVSASAVWPPAGFALAVLLLFGRRVTLGVFLGAFFVNCSTTGEVPSSIGIALGNTLEAVLGAWLVERFACGRKAFSTVLSLLRFVGVAALGTALGATMGVGSLLAVGSAAPGEIQQVWLTWWLGDFVSDLIVAPLIVVWVTRGRPTLTARQVLEAALLVFLVGVVSQFIFGGLFHTSSPNSPLTFLAFPLFLWIGFRFGQRGTLTASCLTCTLAVIGTLEGHGPFTSSDPNSSLIFLQAFMGVLTVTSLIISVMVVERNQAEESLRRSEERYRSLVVAGAQVVWTTTAEGEVIEDLPAWRKLTGQTAEEMKGRGWMSALHSDDLERVNAAWAGSLKSTTSHEIEFRVRTANGSYRYVFSRAVPVLDAKGQLREWVGICRDIDERRRAEQTRAILLTLGQKLNSAISAEDAGRIIVEAAESLFGWDACFIYLCDDLQRVLFPIINIDTIDGKKRPVPPVYVGTPPSALALEVMETGPKLILREPPFDFTRDAHAFGDKARASASLMFAPIRNGEKVVGLFSIQSYTPNAYVNDHLATLQSLADHCGGALERIRGAEELRKAKDELSRQTVLLEKRVAERTLELKETINSLESFCYTIAHDLRAPLRSLQGFTSALAEEYGSKLDDVGHDFCRRIVGSAQHMDRLIQDLLAYGQLMHKDLPIEMVNLEFVISDTLIQLEEGIRTKNARIEVDHPLPNVIGNTTVCEQAIINLVGNALKFIPPHTVPHIRISTEDRGDVIRILVTDNGIGIPAEHHERIFRVFERLHSATAYPGTGVGLAIVRKAVERMAGKVGVESSVGRGSTFWMELRKATDRNRPLPGQLVQGQFFPGD